MAANTLMIWHAHPGPQEEALRRTEDEVLYGGARGGGKTDAGIIKMTDDTDNPHLRALIIRKNHIDLSDWIDRAMEVYTGLGARIAGNPPEIKFPSGAIMRTGHLKDDLAYTRYQGHEYQRMLIEELTQIPDERRYLQLLSSCRSTEANLKPQIFATTNPGGVGHGWVKRRFVDPAPWGTPFQDETTKRWRIFIPAKIDDNPTLMTADPEYVHFLDGLKDTDVEMWKAWRLGDWDTFAGQFFKEFRRDLHVVKAFTPKATLPKYGGMDWGRTASFVFLALALQKVRLTDGRTFHRLWVYQEVDGTDKNPKEWATEIKKAVRLAEFEQIMGDPAMFTKGQDNSVAIADQFKAEDVWIRAASNDRIGGWSVVHDWLSLAPDGLPYLLICDNCNNLIRTLPELVHDEHKVEDVDTEGPDHWADALRYCLKHIKWIDARSGGVQSKQPAVRIPHTAVMVEDKQLGINLDKFKNAK